MEQVQTTESRLNRRLKLKYENKHKRKKLKTIAILAAAILALLFLIVNICIWTRDISKLDYAVAKPLLIYDKNGQLASKMIGRSEGVTFDNIPKSMIHAIVATEDRDFYKHHGIDYTGIMRAMVRNAMAGRVVQGGSTITQQLAKNVFLTNDRTFSRKFKEIFYTKKIERTYSKDKILELYLNSVYFGNGAWGIKSAANTYFGKDVKDLTISESAMLAGLVKAPSYYSPISHYKQAIERRNVVLSLMKEQGYLTQTEYNQAKAEKIALHKKTPGKNVENYPYYVDYVIQEAEKRYGISKEEILSGKYTIYTSLDPKLQKAMENVYENRSMFPGSTSNEMVQSGGVFINPKTGGISALVGGRGTHTFLGFNRATQLKRQPGSTIKPLSVYTPALEDGYGPYSTLQDKPVDFNGYKPKNADLSYRGEVTMYQAVAKSLNVPAVWLLNKIGLDKGYEKVKEFGIPVTEKDRNLSLALGGLYEGTSPLKMAQAYSAFANNGKMEEAHAIVAIKDRDGKIIEKWEKNETKVMKPKTAQLMTYLLQGVIKEGTGVNANIPGMDIAGKTGSTQVENGDIRGTKDHWFVGYTPNIVGAFWLGYDNPDKKQNYLTSSSTQTLPPLFKEILREANVPENTSDFKLPLAEKELKKHPKKQSAWDSFVDWLF
ncbi:penicillin-binding protein 1A [Fictibacillus sp. Mic-4]|uniref:transglycosylase domain-containing protein n=1 Tax=Fictibacillus TaxID=1329200 RepID=UPI0003F5044D|nr:penicillin-binding protein 1A [Fictibacillus gelatini]